MKRVVVFFILLFSVATLFSSCGIYSDWCEGVAHIDSEEVKSL